MIDYSQFMTPDNGQQGPPTLVSQTRDEISTTLRSVRDTLAISFQTLNLTMSSMNMTLRSMTSAISPRATAMGFDATYIPSYSSMVHTGSMSPVMASTIANNSMWGLMFASKPFNVSNMEWSYQRDLELNNRWMGLGVGATSAGASMGAGLFAGSVLTNPALNGLRGMGGIGRGLAGTLGRGIMGGGFTPAGLAMTLGGSILADTVLSPFSNAAESYIRDAAGIRRMSTRFGREFDQSESFRVASGINNMALQELYSTGSMDSRLGSRGIREMTMSGLQMGLFQGRTPDELMKQMKQAAQVVKFLTGVMGSKDVQETMTAISQLKNMGVNAFQNPSFANMVGTQAFRYGSMMGVAPGQMMATAMQGAYGTYGSMGMPSFGGIIPMMQNMALVSEMEKRRLLSPAELAVGGGHQGIAQSMNAAYGSLLRHPGVGQTMLAAAMTPGGRLNMGDFNASGQLGVFGLMGRASVNMLKDPRMLASYLANRTNLESDAMMSGGGQAQMSEVLRNYLMQMPFMQGMGHQDRLNMATVQIKSLLGVDDATAKMMALQALNPGVVNAMESEGNRNLQRGRFFEARARNGRFGPVRQGFDVLTDIPERIKQGFVAPLGQAWANIFGSEVDQEPGMPNIGAGRMGPGTFFNALKAPAPSMDWGRISPTGFDIGMADAYGGSSNIFTRMVAPQSVINQSAAAYMYAAGTERDYYGRISAINNGKEGARDLASIYSGGGYHSLFGEGSSLSDLTQGYQEYLKGGGRNQIASGRTFVAQELQNSGRLGSVNTAGFDKSFDEGALRSRLGSLAYTGSPETLAKRLDSSEFADMARNAGMNTKQFAYYAVQKMRGVGNLGPAFSHWGSDEQTQKQVEELGAALEQQYQGADKIRLFTEMGASGIDLSDTSSFDRLKRFNITGAEVNDWINNNSNFQGDAEAYTAAAAAKAYGNDEEAARQIGKISNKAMRDKAMAEIAGKGQWDVRAGFRESIWAGSPQTEEEARDYFRKNLMGVAGRVSYENWDSILTDMWGVTGEDRDKILGGIRSGGNVNDTIAGIMGIKKPSTVVAGLQNDVRGIQKLISGAGTTLSEGERKKLAAMAHTDISKISANSQEAYKQALGMALGTSMQGASAEQAAQEKADKTIDRTMVKVAGSEASYAIQVVNADTNRAQQEADTARKNLASGKITSNPVPKNNTQAGPGTTTQYGWNPQPGNYA